MFFSSDMGLLECSLLMCWRGYSLRQVSAGAGLLGPVRLGDAEGVAQGRYAGLQVELGGLCQVRLLAKVVEVKQRRASLHLSLHQGRRSDLHPETNKNEERYKQWLESLWSWAHRFQISNTCLLTLGKVGKITGFVKLWGWLISHQIFYRPLDLHTPTYNTLR